MNPSEPQSPIGEFLTQNPDSGVPAAISHGTAIPRTILMTEIEAWGGAERSCVGLANWLDQQNLRCRFVLYRDTCGMGAYASSRLEEIQLQPGPGPLRKIGSLRRYVRNQPPSPYAPLASGYQAVLHATLAGIRRFSTLMHDTPSLIGNTVTSLRGKLTTRIVGYGLRRAAKLGGNTIVTSEFLRNECEHFFGVKAQIVRMGGLHSKALRIRPAEGRLRMLSVSRIESNKRIDWMMRSLAELEREPVPLSKRIDWTLDVAGSGSQLESLRIMASDLGLQDRVRFRGFVSDDTLEALYSQAHLFLMPAVQGYGIPAIESLQRGIPILLHRESGVSDILLDSPWATVITGGCEGMSAGLRNAITGVIEGHHHAIAQPHLPTEAEWAEQVARLSGWIP